MNREHDDPVFSTCGLVNIGVGLKIWAFVRLLADLMGICYLGFILIVFTAIGEDNHFFTELSIIHLMLLLVLVLLVDVGFIITLIVGLFKRSYSILRVNYYYEMYAIVALILMIPVTLYVLHTSDPEFEGIAHFVSFVVIGIIVLLVEVVVFLALKSKLVQLRHRKQPGSVRIHYEDVYD